MRDGARPGRIEQARFFREFSVAARDHGLRYNFIEAFDQPWKRRLEGAMGGAWGLFDSEVGAKFPASGPVEADPHAGRRLAAGLVGAVAGLLLMAVLAGTAGGGLVSAGARVLTAAGLGFGAGALLEAQRVYLVVWSRDAIEWGAGLSILLAGALAAAAVLRLIGSPRSTWAMTASGAVQRYVLFGLAVVVVLLAFDPRYRGFPQALYLLPLASAAIGRLVGEARPAVSPEVRLLGWTVIVGCLVVLWREGLQNTEAIGFVLIAWAYVYLTTGLPAPRAWRRVNETAASSAATAAGS
jgi:hypothetical protein